MKKDKLIVLCGGQNTGKSYMLRKMIENKDFEVIRMIYPKYENKIRADYTAIVKYNGKNIGISSRGDTKILIDEGYKLLEKCIDKFDCVICTCHPSSITYIIQKYNSEYAYVVPKLEANDKDNKKCREIILKLIDS